MRKRILVATLVITLIGFVIYSVVSATLSYESLLENTREILSAQLDAVDAERVGTGDKTSAEALAGELGGVRVTFLDSAGNVTGDSFGVTEGESRADRPEVAAALRGGTGSAVRHSDTTGEDMLYVCRSYGEGLVRIGTRTSTQWDAIVDTLPTLAWFLVLDIFVCLVFSYFATSYALKPVEDLARQSRGTARGTEPLSTKYRELYPITDILNRKNEEIRAQMELVDEEQQRVKRAQESKNEFISNISHEMNTPLTSIKGFAELLEHGDLDEETKKKAYRIIKTQADRLSGLIASIINFNELDNDELPCFDCDVALAARETAESSPRSSATSSETPPNITRKRAPSPSPSRAENPPTPRSRTQASASRRTTWSASSPASSPWTNPTAANTAASGWGLPWCANCATARDGNSP